MTSENTPRARFQTFSDTADPETVAPRVKALRAEMKQVGIDGYLVPRGDRFRGEYVPAHDERLAWLSGFTGSAGLAYVGKRKAAIFVDGRYALQAPAQTDTSVFDVVETPRPSAPGELADFAGGKGIVGYDPWLFSPSEIAAIGALIGDAERLKPVANLIDAIWTEDRPAPPQAPVEVLGDNRTGKATDEKIADLRTEMSKAGADAVLLTLPDSVNWLLNIRGRDVPHTPFALAFAIIPKSGKPTLFIDAGKVGDDAAVLREQCKLVDIDKLPKRLDKLARAGKTVWLDPASSPAVLVQALKDAGATLVEKRDPVLGPKSRKNDAELSGMRDAHRRDAIAMAKFLHWLDTEAPKGELTEIDIAAHLEAFRNEDDSLVDISFDTISGAGPNGAIIHYRVTEATNRTLAPGEIMLVDSGAQYLTGTTDITRTIATGPVTSEQKDRYTRVLKGMIAISMATFPAGTTGAQLDILARQALWQVGLNYNHGTGHGVGAFLSVHEGPVGISPRYHTPLEPGNIISNEPGFYLGGAYGIRIENLVHVMPAEFEGFLAFETLTLAPIDTRLIEPDLMTSEERDWLNAYHARVLHEVGSSLAPDTREWLETATQPI